MNQDSDTRELQLAESLLSIEAKFLRQFDIEDPFNDNKRLRGFLCQKPDHRYGALALTHVDEAEVPQAIFATPKLHYPFGKDGSFHFPPIKKILIYDKLDGTNILAYRYKDVVGKSYLTYKLRLAPVVKNSKWGPFLDMWCELLKKYPGIPELVEKNDCHISFEMYGARNAHLIVYEEPLAVAALFGVRSDASVLPPSNLNLIGVPFANLVAQLEAGQDPVAKYAEIREDMEKRNRPTEDDKISGTEGTIWYAETPNGHISMWKCKPESVENIHWATGINKEAIRATCWNYFETGDDLSYDTLLPLLLEEYQMDDIENFRKHIEACINQVRHEFEFKEQVLAMYDSLGLSITSDKNAVMRSLSQNFKKVDMRNVFTIIIRNRRDN